MAANKVIIGHMLGFSFLLGQLAAVETPGNTSLTGSVSCPGWCIEQVGTELVDSEW